MAPQSMRSNGIYADYEKMAAEGGHRSQGAAVFLFLAISAVFIWFEQVLSQTRSGIQSFHMKTFFYTYRNAMKWLAI